MRGLSIVALLLILVGVVALVTAIRGRGQELRKAIFE